MNIDEAFCQILRMVLLHIQIRAIAGLGWKEDAIQFEKYARAVQQSAKFALGPLGNSMDLKSSKMLVTAILKGVKLSQNITVLFKLEKKDGHNHQILKPCMSACLELISYVVDMDAVFT